MIRVRISKIPDLKIKVPGRTFYTAVAIEAKKNVRKRTETQKVDHEGKAFKPYTPDYEAFRKEYDDTI